MAMTTTPLYFASPIPKQSYSTNPRTISSFSSRISIAKHLSLFVRSPPQPAAAAVVVAETVSAVVKAEPKKTAAVPPSFSSLGKTKDRENVVSVPISFHSLVNTRNKGKAIATPCPLLLRTRGRRNEFNEAGKIGLSKSCKVPPAKHKKKRCRVLLEQDVSEHALLQEFIEEQRAYFKEVDDFELPEEEIRK